MMENKMNLFVCFFHYFADAYNFQCKQKQIIAENRVAVDKEQRKNERIDVYMRKTYCLRFFFQCKQFLSHFHTLKGCCTSLTHYPRTKPKSLSSVFVYFPALVSKFLKD